MACCCVAAPSTPKVAALLYSANHFIIHYSTPGSLAPLLRLAPLSLQSLTSLKIVLNQASCHIQSSYDHVRKCCSDEYTRSYEYCAEFHHGENGHQTPLPSPDPASHGDGLEATKAMLREWHSAVVHMCPSICSARLTLSFVCDIDPHHEQTLEIAQLATAPLQLLPPLKDCHIRLCKVPNPQLQQLSHDAVMAARRLTMPYSTPPSGPLLMRLPRELRLLILEHTDLVTPWKEVSWGRRDGGYTVQHMGCTDKDGEGFTAWPVIHHGCQFGDCWLNDNNLPSVGCFCRRRHTAFSSRCNCWIPPGASPFLVCRALCADARLVFFSRNRFIIHDDSARAPVDTPSSSNGPYPHARLAASLFLRGTVPASCLGHLRFLELVFPPYRWRSWPQQDDPAVRDWAETAAWLLRGRRLNLPALTVRLVTAEDDNDPGLHRLRMTDAQGEAVLASYEGIMRPLRRWGEGLPGGVDEDGGGGGGLARFYAELTCPLYWTPAMDARRRQPDGYEFERERNRERKEAAERGVMGARYGSLYAGGRREPPASIWRGVYNGILGNEFWSGPY